MNDRFSLQRHEFGLGRVQLIRKVDHERLLHNPILTEPGSDDELAMADELLKIRSPRDVAAAFVKLYRAGLPAPEDIEEEAPFRERSDKPRHDRPRDTDYKPREPREQVMREPRNRRPRGAGSLHYGFQ